MKERLTILKDNKVISEEVFNEVLKLHEGLFKDEQLQEYDSYSIAMTHLAMAMQRNSEGSPVNEMDQEIMNQLESDKNFQKAKELTNKVVQQLEMELPESEIHFMWLHFLNIFNEKGER